MNYLVRKNPGPLGFSYDDIEQAYNEYTGRTVKDDLRSVIGEGFPSSLDFTKGLSEIIESKVQYFIEEEVTSIIDSVLAEIPNQQEMEVLGERIGRRIQEEIQNAVLPQIYKRVDDTAVSTQGLGFVSDNTRLEIYSRIADSLPHSKVFNIKGIQLTINVKEVFQKALPFDKFSQAFDRVNPLIETVREEAETAIRETGKNIATLIAFNSFLLGGIAMYGFLKLYNSVK